MKNLLPPPQQQFNPPKTPKSLTYICNIIVNDKKYPNICLQSSYAYAVHCYYKNKWENYCMTEVMAYIPNNDTTEVHDVVEYFNIPEFSIERDQVELKTMDYTHMLTNIRNHILTHGYDFCPKEHFQHIADNRPDILSRALVHDKIDIQNVFCNENVLKASKRLLT